MHCQKLKKEPEMANLKNKVVEDSGKSNLLITLALQKRKKSNVKRKNLFLLVTVIRKNTSLTHFDTFFTESPCLFNYVSLLNTGVY